MKNGSAEQRIIDVLPGFSPRPASPLEPLAIESPSNSSDPETHSPDGEEALAGPILQRPPGSQALEEISIKDGIVSFGK